MTQISMIVECAFHSDRFHQCSEGLCTLRVPDQFFCIINVDRSIQALSFTERLHYKLEDALCLGLLPRRRLSAVVRSSNELKGGCREKICIAIKKCTPLL